MFFGMEHAPERADGEVAGDDGHVVHDRDAHGDVRTGARGTAQLMCVADAHSVCRHGRPPTYARGWRSLQPNPEPCSCTVSPFVDALLGSTLLTRGTSRSLFFFSCAVFMRPLTR